MIGCVAKASGDAIHADPEEMEEVRWVSRADVLAAVAASAAPDNPYYGAPSLGRPCRLDLVAASTLHWHAHIYDAGCGLAPGALESSVTASCKICIVKACKRR